MAKYDERFKLDVVKQYLCGGGGAKRIGHERGLHHATIERWVASYRAHGLAGLQRKGASYDAAFKLRVLKRMWRERWSLSQTAAAFDVRCAGHIGKWERQYHADGIEALEPRRGRAKSMTVDPPKPPTESPPVDGDTRTIEQLRKENEYLRAEVAYLKKLDALIQQKRAAARKKRKS